MDYNTFAGNVKKSHCTVTKLDTAFNHADSRCWSALINPGRDNIIVTHSINKNDIGSQTSDIFSSQRIMTDVENEDVFDVIDLFVDKSNMPEETTDSLE
jgi:hypothetical protein